MSLRYIAFSAILVAFSIARLFLPEPTLPAPSDVAVNFPDAESHFALGTPYPLEQAGTYELELVPGVSDELAEEIHKASTRIADRADALRPELRYQAFETVSGVGPGKARLLAQHFTTSPRQSAEQTGADCSIRQSAQGAMYVCRGKENSRIAEPVARPKSLPKPKKSKKKSKKSSS